MPNKMHSAALQDKIYRKHKSSRPLTWFLLVLVLPLTLTGCGLFASSEEPEGPISIRTGHPTFTPTVMVEQAPAQQAPVVSQEQATPVPPPAAQAAADSGAKAVINGPLVNARSGPGIEFDIVGTVERGAEMDIVGVNPARDWWQVCCVEGAQAWVTSEFVDTLGLVDSVPVVGAAVEAAPVAPVATEAPPVAAAPVTPTPVPAPVVNFALETQEQFPETSVVRIFLYVYTSNNALEGYSLRVTKDGQELPVEGSSFGGQPAFTWPFQDPRQRFQNFKVEFPNTPVQGKWEVQLIDTSGAIVGPPASFTLSANDPQQELYVRYAQQ